MGRSRRKLPSPESVRTTVCELLDLHIGPEALEMPPIRCVCHGGPLHACPDRPEMFPMVDEGTARAALARLGAAVELWAITEDEADGVRDRAERFLPDWRRRLREEGPG